MADAFKYTSEELRTDKDVVLVAVSQDGDVLRDASEELRRDKEFLLEAIKQNAGVLQCVSIELQRDKGFVLEAVKQNAWALQCVSKELQNDPEILAVIESQRKKEEQQHTIQEIAEGIEPTETAINEIQAEMIAAQTKEDIAQINSNDQK